MQNHTFNVEPLAKPSGITLAQHTANVIAEVSHICQSIPSSLGKYKTITHKSLFDRLRFVSEFHDKGKKHSEWQNPCIKDYQRYLQWKSHHHDANFPIYCRTEYPEAGQYLRNSGVRHELFSIQEANKYIQKAPKKIEPTPLLAAIASHHSKLSYGSENRWKDFKQYWDYFCKKSNDVSENCRLNELCGYVYEYDGLRGLLQLADHRASAKEDGTLVPNINRFSYQFPFLQRRGIQKMVESEWEKDMLLVRAPTGAGKTDAALLWASKQIGAGKADRMVIVMPTRFTSNALAISVAESLSGTGLYHSSAWCATYQKVKEGTISFQDALALHKMARFLVEPVTVTTIDHLLMSLTQMREDHHLINFNVANSCVVIDEADFYDDFTLANIQILLQILKHWNVPVLVMSASIPNSALSFYQKTGYRVNSILEDTTINKYSSKFEIKDIRPCDDIDELKPLLRECLIREQGIVYLNTVDRAIEVYNLLQHLQQDLGSDVPLVLYHSRFTEPDKAIKEQCLLNILGKEQWSRGKARGIAILTQIGEISINISADIMVSELCPIDRLIQRVGRLCRFGSNNGELYVIVPNKNGSLYPAPYGSYHQGKWEASQSLLKTKDVLHKGAYSENDLLSALNMVYDVEVQISTKARANAKKLEEMFINNWLINPAGQINENENECDFWKSRNIGPQDIVFIEKPPTNHFINYSEYLNYQLLKSLSLPIYMFKKIRHEFDMVNIGVGTENKMIYVLREGFYNSDIGLFVPTNRNNDNFL